MKTTNRFAALMITMTMGAGIVVLPIGARASEEGKRNTTLALGAVAAGLLLTQKNKLPGVVAAAGAAYAYTQYNASIESRHEQDRYYGYDPNGYRYPGSQNTNYHNNTGYRNGNTNDYRNGSTNDYRNGSTNDYRNGSTNDYRNGNSSDHHQGYNTGHYDARNRDQNGTNNGNYPNTYQNSSANTYPNDGYRYGENGNIRNENYDGRRAQSGQDRTVRAARSTR